MKLTRHTTLASLFAGLLGFSQISLSHNDGAYCHSSDAVAHNTQWMSRLAHHLRVSELSLPGIHDTMSIRAGDARQNQTMTLAQQLESLRAFLWCD